MSGGRETLQRSLLALISANTDLDMFELTALAYELEPDRQGQMVVSAAHIASVRRALVVLFRGSLAIGSTTRQRGGRRARAALEHAGRPWFWMEFDDTKPANLSTPADDDHAVVDTTMRIGLSDLHELEKSPVVRRDLAHRTELFLACFLGRPSLSP